MSLVSNRVASPHRKVISFSTNSKSFVSLIGFVLASFCLFQMPYILPNMGQKLKIAVVCSSNQNRSMEAHNFLR